MLGDVRIASVNLKTAQAELVGWADGASVSVTASNVITGVSLAPATATVAGGVASVTLAAAATATLGLVRLDWVSGTETMTTTLDVRALRLPVHEVPQANTSGALNATSNADEWRRERALSDALGEFELACKGTPMAPRRVQVTPTVCGTRIDWGVRRVHRVVSCSDPSVDVSQIVVEPGYGRGSVPSGASFVVEHGQTVLDPDVRRGILLEASKRLVDGPADARGFLLHDAGATRILRNNETFDIPVLERALRRHRPALIA